MSKVLPKVFNSVLKNAPPVEVANFTPVQTRNSSSSEPKFPKVLKEAAKQAEAKRLTQAPKRLRFQSSIFRPNPYLEKS